MTPANEEDYDYETPESETEIIPSEDNSGRQSRELHTEETTTEPVNHQQATARNVTAHKPTQRSTANIANLEDEVKRILHPLHEEWKEGIEIAHETKLADEIRQVYCELSNIRRLQTITLALSNGILAAAALDMPHCSRLHGMGQALLLQECEKKEANVTAIEIDQHFESLLKLAGLPDFTYVINTSFDKGQTCLHLTSSEKKGSLTKILLENRAYIEEADTDGNTPLHVAADVENAKILFRYGASIYATNNNGEAL